MGFRTSAVYALMVLLGALRPIAAQSPSDQSYQRAAEYSRAQRGDAVLVMVDGKIVFEQYHGMGRVDLPHELYSGTKSFSGVMAVAAQQDGLLTLDEPVSRTITEWQRDPAKRSITIRQLLSLTSGYEGGRQGRPPAYGQALSGPMLGAPGSVFDYGPYPFQTFGELMKRKLRSRGETVDGYLHRRILDPIGIRVGAWPGAERGEPQLPHGARLTAREWVKFGEFIRNGGSWGGKQLVPRDLLQECFSGSAANPAYGLTWWLNASVSAEVRERIKQLDGNLEGVDQLPGMKGMVMAAGARKQRLYVIPELRMVVVRFGRSMGRGYDDARFLELLTGR